MVNVSVLTVSICMRSTNPRVSSRIIVRHIFTCAMSSSFRTCSRRWTQTSRLRASIATASKLRQTRSSTTASTASTASTWVARHAWTYSSCCFQVLQGEQRFTACWLRWGLRLSWWFGANNPARIVHGPVICTDSRPCCTNLGSLDDCLHQYRVHGRNIGQKDERNRP